MIIQNPPAIGEIIKFVPSGFHSREDEIFAANQPLEVVGYITQRTRFTVDPNHPEGVEMVYVKRMKPAFFDRFQFFNWEYTK